MEIKTFTEITISITSSDIEMLLKKNGLVGADLRLKQIVGMPEDGLKLEFEKVVEKNEELNSNHPPVMDKVTFLNFPFEDLDISTGTLNCLKSVDIKTPKELLEYQGSLMEIKNFGKRARKELNLILKFYGESIK